MRIKNPFLCYVVVTCLNWYPFVIPELIVIVSTLSLLLYGFELEIKSPIIVGLSLFGMTFLASMTHVTLREHQMRLVRHLNGDNENVS